MHKTVLPSLPSPKRQRTIWSQMSVMVNWRNSALDNEMYKGTWIISEPWAPQYVSAITLFILHEISEGAQIGVAPSVLDPQMKKTGSSVTVKSQGKHNVTKKSFCCCKPLKFRNTLLSYINVSWLSAYCFLVIRWTV